MKQLVGSTVQLDVFAELLAHHVVHHLEEIDDIAFASTIGSQQYVDIS